MNTKFSFWALALMIFWTGIASAQQIGNGYATYTTDPQVDFNGQLLSGCYNALNPTGGVPDLSYDNGYMHLFVIRHPNVKYNHQLQIASSLGANDRLFFRKIAVSTPVWNEIATRGTNTFNGGQIINGNTSSLFTIESTSEADILYKSNTSSWQVGTGDASIGANKFYFYNTSTRMVIDENGNVGIGTTTPSKLLTLSGLHENTQLLLHSLGGSTNDRQADLMLWASEPLATYDGVGISNNIINYNKSTGKSFQLINNARGGSYIRLLNNAMIFNVVSQTGEDKQALYINSSGNIGIGTNTLNNKLEVAGDINLTGSIKQNGNAIGNWAQSGSAISYAAGDVTIGTSANVSSTSYRLNVWGKIRANEVVVNTDGADFVFEPSYKLRPLTDLETFIKQNKHLPEIAPASEMMANGANLSELNTKLLQKVEELTLYLIEQNKKMEELQRIANNNAIENNSMKSQLEELKKTVQVLKTK